MCSLGDSSELSCEESSTEDIGVIVSRRKHGYGDIGPTTPVRQVQRLAATRDIAAHQRLWISHCLNASKLYAKSLWRVLHAVRTQAKTTQDAVLQACSVMLPHSERRHWPLRRHTIDSTIRKKLGSFHSRVTRTIRINLGHHPHRCCRTPTIFSFIDPVYAWAACALRLSETHTLHFESVQLVDPVTRERLYGASVQHGDVMKEACDTRPGAPALFGISYDSGQASRRRSYAPILISVGNSDYNGKDACICIGYMPQLPNDVCAEAKHELRQAVMKAIVDVIEKCAKDGFTCLLRGSNGENIERILFPVLARMEFDTKERTKFFCLARERACGCGSGPRRGHSLFRHCTLHSSRRDLQEKRRIVCDDTEPQQERKAAASSISRRGLHPDMQCTALAGLRHAVLHWPSRIFFGLFSYDIMHGCFINCIGYLLDTVISIMRPQVLQEFDRRVATLPPFRRMGGTTTARVRKLSSSAYLTAEMKVRDTQCIFQMYIRNVYIQRIYNCCEMYIRNVYIQRIYNCCVMYIRNVYIQRIYNCCEMYIRNVYIQRIHNCCVMYIRNVYIQRIFNCCVMYMSNVYAHVTRCVYRCRLFTCSCYHMSLDLRRCCYHNHPDNLC